MEIKKDNQAKVRFWKREQGSPGRLPEPTAYRRLFAVINARSGVDEERIDNALHADNGSARRTGSCGGADRQGAAAAGNLKGAWRWIARTAVCFSAQYGRRRRSPAQTAAPADFDKVAVRRLEGCLAHGPGVQERETNDKKKKKKPG